MSKKIPYRLGIDLGASSLGWCVLELNNNEPTNVMNSGVRIFSDGRDAQTYTPLSVNRREKRGLRRQRDRFVARKKQLMDFLIEHNLMPKNIKERKALQEINPYYLRAKALDEKLDLHKLGRALFHLNQRRGFKSNRIQQKTDPHEAGATKLGIRQLKDKIEECNARTLGEYFYKQTKFETPIRIRPKTVKSKNSYDIYPERAMYEDEFEQIWNKQAEFHSLLTTELKEQIKKHIIFYQRPLKPQAVGTCNFEEGEERAPSCLRTSQRFRIHQEVNTLELRRYDDTSPCLTAEQKQKIKDFLLNEPSELKKDGTITFDKLRKKLGLHESTFNLEDEKRKELKGDKVMKDFSSKDYFGSQWLGFSDGLRDEIILRLLEETYEQKIILGLIETYSVSPENAQRISDYRLPDGYSRLSVKAMQKILPFLEAGQLYSDACRTAGYHHSDFRPGEKLDRLPYYGEALPKRVIGGTFELKDKPQDNAPTAQYEKYYGKINNPTVHVGLNQLRKLVNSL
ncbi:type II CRISPR RNA-guided endonuclease Cas9, partial [bacterium]|nr:type II CRISPR RNA-guided endonuclease Cas9 [bacterium]